MEPKGSWLWSQEHTTRPNPKTDETNQHDKILFFWIHFFYYPPTYVSYHVLKGDLLLSTMHDSALQRNQT
jgi:hypothetical protein